MNCIEQEEVNQKYKCPFCGGTGKQYGMTCICTAHVVWDDRPAATTVNLSDIQKIARLELAVNRLDEKIERLFGHLEKDEGDSHKQISGVAKHCEIRYTHLCDGLEEIFGRLARLEKWSKIAKDTFDVRIRALEQDHICPTCGLK